MATTLPRDAPGTHQPARRRASPGAAATLLAGVSWRVVPPLAAVLALGLGLPLVLRVIVRPLAILVLAITLGEALAPLVERLQRRMPRAAAISVVYLVLLAIAGLVSWLTLPATAAQVSEIGTPLPDFLAAARRWVTRWDEVAGGTLLEALTARLADLGGMLVKLPLQLASSVLELLVVIFLSIYWLVGTPALRQFALSLVPPPASQARVGEVLSATGRAMGGYVRGAAINAVIMGALAWLGLSLIGVDYALVLGVLTMLGEPVPYVGPVAAGAVVVLFALAPGPTKVLLARFTALQQLEGHILTPNIMSEQTHTSQAVVIFALLAGAVPS
jgi:predicted PurR-regulated permease PerM